MVSLGFDATKVEPSTSTGKTWSHYQQDIFRFIASGEGNGLVMAVAGSGKSTTIVEGINYADGECIFLAFNKSIADELKKRGVNARTFHSLCYGPALNYFAGAVVKDNKTRFILSELYQREFDDVQGYILKLVGLAKNNGVGFLLEDTYEVWKGIADGHAFELPDDHDPKVVIGVAREVFHHGYGWNISTVPPTPVPVDFIDFDDMLYLVARNKIPLKKYDFVFCDEAQDTNPIQRVIVRHIMRDTSRAIFVGDDAQAIYGFRGAGSTSMREIADDFRCVLLPLSITYRCATSIAEYARKWCPQLEAAPGAPAGLVEEKGLNWTLADLQAHDLILCRTTAPLLKVAFYMVKSRRRVTVLGRDISVSLRGLVQKMNVRKVHHLETKLNQYRMKETVKMVAKGEDKAAEALSDRVGAVLALCESMDPHETTQEVIGIINNIFDPKADSVILSTIHKAKGLEAERVYWLDAWNCPSKFAKTPWQLKQEENLCNVAATRAKQALYLIDSTGERD